MPASTAQRNQARQTRDAVLAAAREVFIERGYADAGTEEIVARAELTRGALYHHFAGKKDLFRAVFQAFVREWLERQGPGEADADPVEYLRSVFRAYLLEASQDAALQRLFLVDGPGVLGWAEWRELGKPLGVEFVEAPLARGIAAGLLQDLPVALLAPMLLAAADEAAMVIANSSEPERARAQAEVTLDRLLDGLRT